MTRSSPHTDLALDRRLTSHMSAGMLLYVRKLIELVPRIAPDLRIELIGAGDNFDVSEQIGLPLEILLRRPRLVHLPGPFIPLLVPAPFVLTIHDLIDLHYPHFGKGRVVPYYRYGVGPVARRARAVITDDERTAGDLEALLGVQPARIRIVPLGVDAPPGVPKISEPPYFLYVGNHRLHKDLDTLVRAWAGLPPGLEVHLWLTGRDDVGAAFKPFAREHGRIVFSGVVSDEELARLYRGARAYVHPALREGFGLPMLEAMRAGIPVFAQRTALPTVLAAHAWTFEAGDVVGLRNLMQRILEAPQRFEHGAQSAQAATRELDWEHTVERTVAIYREFLA